jgi:predicted ATP-grasp superfamily ATP-dependent carboligase
VTARVLVTDGSQRAALAVTRSLGRAGHEVMVGADRRRSLAGASRYCMESAVFPDALEEPAAFAAAVARSVREARIEIVLPITEAALLALLPGRESLGASLPWPSAEIVARSLNKEAVLETAARLGIAVPRGVTLDGPDALSRLTAPVFPVAVKPIRSVQTAADGSRAKFGVQYARSAPELQELIRSLPSSAFPVLVQERIVGDGRGVFVLRWGGRRLAAFAHRRLREKPPAGGVSVYCESVALEPELLQAADRLLESLDWSGVAMVEFKRSARDATDFLMEINGRFWGSLQLAIDAGVDFPALLVAATLGAPVEAPGSYRVGARSRWWWGDIDHLITRLRRSGETLGLPEGTPKRSRTAMDILLPWRSPGRNEILRLSDPRPALHESIEWLRGLR